MSLDDSVLEFLSGATDDFMQSLNDDVFNDDILGQPSGFDVLESVFAEPSAFAMSNSDHHDNLQSWPEPAPVLSSSPVRRNSAVYQDTSPLLQPPSEFSTATDSEAKSSIATPVVYKPQRARSDSALQRSPRVQALSPMSDSTIMPLRITPPTLRLLDDSRDKHNKLEYGERQDLQAQPNDNAKRAKYQSSAATPQPAGHRPRSLMTPIQTHPSYVMQCCGREQHVQTCRAEAIEVAMLSKMAQQGFKRSGRLLHRYMSPSSCCYKHSVRYQIDCFQPSGIDIQIMLKMARYLASNTRPMDRKPSRSPSRSTLARAQVYPLPQSSGWSHPRLASRGSSFSSELSAIGSEDVTLRLHTLSLSELCNDLVYRVLPPGGRPLHALEVDLVPVAPSSERYMLYIKDAHRTRKDDITIKMFQEQVIATPVVYEKHVPGQNPLTGCGTFQLEVKMDGKLIAVQIVDILDHGLLPVVLFTDPQFDFLELPFYVELRLMEFCQNLHRDHAAFRYLYQQGYVVQQDAATHTRATRPCAQVLDANNNWMSGSEFIQRIANNSSTSRQPTVQQRRYSMPNIARASLHP